MIHKNLVIIAPYSDVSSLAQLESFKRSGAGLSGRELFEYNQSLFVDDEEGDETVYVKPEDIDESLFVDEEEETKQSEEPAADNGLPEEYDPATWKDANKTPKALLVDLQSKQKIEPKNQAKFEVVSSTPTEGFVIKCVLPSMENKEFITVFPYRQRKTAEHNAALMAYNYLMSQQQNKE